MGMNRYSLHILYHLFSFWKNHVRVSTCFYPLSRYQMEQKLQTIWEVAQGKQETSCQVHPSVDEFSPCWWFNFNCGNSRAEYRDPRLWLSPRSDSAARLCGRQAHFDETGTVFGRPASGRRSSPGLPGPLSVPAHLHLLTAAPAGPGCGTPAQSWSRCSDTQSRSEHVTTWTLLVCCHDSRCNSVFLAYIAWWHCYRSPAAYCWDTALFFLKSIDFWGNESTCEKRTLTPMALSSFIWTNPLL